MGTPRTLDEYYSDPAVRARIREYCGGGGGSPPTCVFLAAMTGSERPFVLWEHAPRHPVWDLDALLSAGADIARSMWDKDDLIVHVDLDYLNIDVPGEAYHHPAEVFFKLEPTYHATLRVLKRFDLPLLCLTTGQGYHFSGRLPLDSEVTDRLAALPPETPAWWGSVRARSPAWIEQAMTARHARAYVGGGMLIEFLAHRIVRGAARRSPIPVVLNGTIVGTGLVGRECVSIDLSYAGDPLDLRHMRVGFGAYQKHRFRADVVAHRGASGRPAFIAVPRGRDSLAFVVACEREFRYAARAARSRTAVLPIVTDGVRRALDAYGRSPLAAFHREFYGTPALDDAACGRAFAALPLDPLADCVVRPLLAPNDALLQPAVVQHVTRALMAERMRPRDISAIVRSRYLSDFGWGARWDWRDATTRAEFDVRVFSGMVATGLDRGVDFNCRSAQEKGLCPGGGCTRDLRVDRDRLLAARGS